MESLILNPNLIKPEIFYLVDFASRLQPGFRNRIVPIKEVPGLLQGYGNYECYTTCFLFTEDLREYLEAQRSAGAGKVSVSGYRGKVSAGYLPIDIDSKDLSIAQNTARHLVKFLLSELGASDKSLLVYFSGSAGFHLMIDKRIFGKVAPSENLHITFSILREKLVEKSQADTDTVDFSIKDKLRLWRVPNTVNRKSNLYKVQLTLEELFIFNTELVKKKAEKPQSLFHTDRTGLIPIGSFPKTNRRAEALYNEVLKKTEERMNRQTVSIIEAMDAESRDIHDALCKAELGLAGCRVQEGERNSSAIRLLSKIRRKGFSRKNGEEFINEWNRKCGIGLLGYELRSLVNSAYSRPVCYNFGCNDEILLKYCPYENRNECTEYRMFKKRR